MTRSTIRKYCLEGIAVIGLLLMFSISLAPKGSIQDAKLARAQLGCTGLAQAIEAFVDHKANTKHEFPLALSDLVRPPFGGSSFLRKGEADLMDAWGKPFQMEQKKTLDGRDYILVFTTAPDGTLISQFGYGTNATPKF